MQIEIDPEEEKWTASSSSIDNVGNKYFVERDAAIRDGLEDWLEHLREKNWFTKRSESSFVAAWNHMMKANQQ